MKKYITCFILSVSAMGANAQASDHETAQPRRQNQQYSVLRREYTNKYRLSEYQALSITPLLRQLVNASDESVRIVTEQRIKAKITGFKNQLTVSL